MAEEVSLVAKGETTVVCKTRSPASEHFVGSRSFFLSGGSYVGLAALGGQGMEVRSINGARMVGDFVDANAIDWSFLMTNGAFTAFLPPGASYLSSAGGVNAAGTIVGNFWDASGVNHGYVRSLTTTAAASVVASAAEATAEATADKAAVAAARAQACEQVKKSRPLSLIYRCE